MRRNITSMSGNTTSQPKLYSLVRLSFIGDCRSYESLPRRSLGEGGSI